jgi:hypothetical protein
MALIILSIILSSFIWHWVANIPLGLGEFSQEYLINMYYKFTINTPISSKFYKEFIGRHMLGGIFITMSQLILVDVFATMISAIVTHSNVLKTIHDARVVAPNGPTTRILSEQESQWISQGHYHKLQDLTSETWIVCIMHCYRLANSFLLFGFEENDNRHQQEIAPLPSFSLSKFLSFLMVSNITGLGFGFIPFVIGRFGIFLVDNHLCDYYYTDYRLDIFITWIIGCLLLSPFVFLLFLYLLISKRFIHSNIYGVAQWVLKVIISRIMSSCCTFIAIGFVSYVLVQYYAHAKVKSEMTMMPKPISFEDFGPQKNICSQTSNSIGDIYGSLGAYEKFTGLLLLSVLFFVHVFDWLNQQLQYTLVAHIFNNILIVCEFTDLSDTWQKWHSSVYEPITAGMISYASIFKRSIYYLACFASLFLSFGIFVKFIGFYDFTGWILVIITRADQTAHFFTIFIYCLIIKNLVMGVPFKNVNDNNRIDLASKYYLLISQYVIKTLVPASYLDHRDGEGRPDTNTRVKIWFFNTAIFRMNVCCILIFVAIACIFSIIGTVAIWIGHYSTIALVDRNLSDYDHMIVNALIFYYLLTHMEMLLSRIMDLYTSFAKILFHAAFDSYFSREGFYPVLKSIALTIFINILCWGVIPYVTGLLAYSLLTDHFVVLMNLKNAASPFSINVTRLSLGFMIWNYLSDQPTIQNTLHRNLVCLKFGNDIRRHSKNDGFDLRLLSLQAQMSIFLIVVMSILYVLYSFVPVPTQTWVSYDFEFSLLYFGLMMGRQLIPPLNNLVPDIFEQQFVA